jgi:hypothetical protein
MVLLTRSLTNASSTDPVVMFVPGFDHTNPVVIAPSSTLDLLSVMPADSLHAMQGNIASLIESGRVMLPDPVNDTIDSSVLYPAAMMDWISANDTQIVFSPTASSGTHLAGAATALQVKSAAGAIDSWDGNTTVVVSVASGGTAPRINGQASPVTVTMSMGQAVIVVTDSASGTVHLAISAPSRSLTVSSTYIATLS